MSCPECHQSKSVDLLSMRCTRCHPIRIKDVRPEIQHYARSARFQNYKEFVVMTLFGPIAIAVCLYYSVGGLSILVAIFMVAILAAMGATGYFFFRKRNLLLRYYRLGCLINQVEPVDAEMKYSVRGEGSRFGRKCYFNLVQLGPNSVWPSSMSQELRVDTPPDADEELVYSEDVGQKFFTGFDPVKKPPMWAKIYFDPDQSGNAVICIADKVFVSVIENERFIW